MVSVKKSLLISASALGIGMAGLGAVSAVSAATTTDSTTGSSSIVDKIASKFGLDKTKVQAVFDEDREAHHAEMQAKRTEALKQAVTDGKLTQAQADHITSVWKEIEALMGDSSPKDASTETRTAIKEKMDALRTWESEQNLDLSSIEGLGGPGGRGDHGPGGNRGEKPDDATNSSSTTN